jgi:transposase InsO family protein
VLAEGWTLTAAAEAAGVSVRTVGKWVCRYRREGEEGLLDCSSAPVRVANRTPDERVEAIVSLRRVRMTAAEIAEILLMPLSTVSGILTRIGLGNASRLEPVEPANRYQKQWPGELVHIDVKRLGRIDRDGRHLRHDPRKPSLRRSSRRRIGWEYLHVCVDDATRLAYAEVLEDEKATTAVGFLTRAIAFYEHHSIHVQAVMTDNGPAYRSILHALACRTHGLRHTRTRPYRPRTNGKAERFIRTLLGGWAYGALYRHSTERTAALDGWIDYYNHQRRHSALGHKPPIARLNERTNLIGTYS